MRLRSLSDRQLTIAYLQIEKGMTVPEIASELRLPFEGVEVENFLARHHVISYLTTRGVCVGDVADEEFSRAVMQ
jgi:hypothetical protein